VAEHIRLTVEIKQHFGVLRLYYWFDEENIFATKQVQENDLGLIFCVPGSEWHCTSFFVSAEIPGSRQFDDCTNLQFFMDPKRLVPGQVWMMDNFSKQ